MKCQKRPPQRNVLVPLGGIAFPHADVIIGKQHVLHEGGDAVGVSGDAPLPSYLPNVAMVAPSKYSSA